MVKIPLEFQTKWDFGRRNSWDPGMNVMTLYLKTWSGTESWTSSCRRWRCGGRTLTPGIKLLDKGRATTCSSRYLTGGKKLLNRVGKFSHSFLCMLESVLNSVTQLWALCPSWVHLCLNVAVSSGTERRQWLAIFSKETLTNLPGWNWQTLNLWRRDNRKLN